MLDFPRKLFFLVMLLCWCCKHVQFQSTPVEFDTGGWMTMLALSQHTSMLDVDAVKLVLGLAVMKRSDRKDSMHLVFMLKKHLKVYMLTFLKEKLIRMDYC